MSRKEGHAEAQVRPYRPGDKAGAYHVCLKTGDHGKDGAPFYQEDPDALGRIYVGPYLEFEPELAFILEDASGVCGYCLGAFDSKNFYRRYEEEWRPTLTAEFPEPQGNQVQWTRVQWAHYLYYHPDYFCPEPYAAYPSHLHIDLLEHVRGHGHGRRMTEALLKRLRERGSPGVHLGMSASNTPAYQFYQKLGFHELVRTGQGEQASCYMGQSLPHGCPPTGSKGT